MYQCFLSFCFVIYVVQQTPGIVSDGGRTHPKYLDKQIKKPKKKTLKKPNNKKQTKNQKTKVIWIWQIMWKFLSEEWGYSFNFPFDFLFFALIFHIYPKRGNGNYMQYMVIKFSIFINPPPHYHHLMLRAWLYTCINTSYTTHWMAGFNANNTVKFLALSKCICNFGIHDRRSSTITELIYWKKEKLNYRPIC